MQNCEEFKITGIVKKKVAEINALIEVIALNNRSKKSEKDDLIKMFPPNGCVFGPSFFKNNNKISEGDIIDFNCGENSNYTGLGQHTKYIVINGSVRKNNYIKTYSVHALPLQGKTVNIGKINHEIIDKNIEFCISDGQKILGKLRLPVNGPIEPVYKKRVYVWDRNSCEIISDGDVDYVKFPDEKDAYDCMEDSQLFEWFRQKLRKIDPEYVKFLDDQTKWRKYFPDYFDNSDQESFELDQNRFERVKNKFSGMTLSINAIHSFMNTSQTLRKAFDESIQRHINSFETEYGKKLTETKEKYKLEKTALDDNLKTIQVKIETQKNHLQDLEQKISDHQKKIDQILESKERILSDFSIINEVINSTSSSNTDVVQNNMGPYLMETVVPNKNCPMISSKNKCINRIKYFLESYTLNSNMAARLLNVFLCFNGILIEDISYGLALAKAFGNAKYLIQQVGPDWMQFKQLWENGLSEIWRSSHDNPDIIHILLLEDINLSSPECYARPLIDVMQGIRPRLPYAKNGMPENLKILATKIPFEEPPIGLPLYQTIFKAWGVVGFRNKSQTDKPPRMKQGLDDGYFSFHSIRQFTPDEFEKDNVEDDVKAEYEYVFCSA